MKTRALSILLTVVLAFQCVSVYAAESESAEPDLFVYEDNMEATDFEDKELFSDDSDQQIELPDEPEISDTLPEAKIPDEELISFEESEESSIAAADVEDEPTSPASRTWGSDIMNLTTTKEAAQEAYDQGIIKDTVMVAVIDTGINISHELFTDRISPLSRSFLTGQDTTDYEDQNGHGTTIAGIIAANTPSNVELLILQALDEENKGTAESIAQAIRYAISNHADIINLSLSTSKETVGDETAYEDYVSRIDAALKEAADAGIHVIASAGNDGKDIDDIGAYPAGSENVYTVSAFTQDLKLFEYSNYGSKVDFYAPGENVYCAAMGNYDSYEYVNGTSTAAPFVSSAFALTILSYRSWCDTDISDLVKTQASNGLLNRTDFFYGYGCPVLDLVFEDHSGLPVLKISEYTEDEEGNIEFHWNAQEGVSYRVYRQIVGLDDDFVLMDTVSDSSYTDDGLLYGFWKVWYCVESEESGIYESDRSDPCEVFGYQGKRIEVQTGKDTGFINDNLYFKMNRYEKIKAEVMYPSEYYNSMELEWFNENPDVVSVDKDGNLEALTCGIARIHLQKAENAYFPFISLVISVTDVNCGDNLSWEITEGDGEVVLTISGTGEMYNYADEWNTFCELPEDPRPWAEDLVRITKVVVEDGVTSIGKFAFLNAYSLKSVEGMKTVQKINTYAFGFCMQLAVVDEMPCLEALCYRAFTDCTNLVRFPLPDGLKTIEGSVFGNCRNLKELKIPSGMEKIEWEAFSESEAEVLIIPEDIDTEEELEKIIWGALPKSFLVSEDNPAYLSENGIIYSRDKKTIHAYPKGNPEEGFVIPEFVENIGQYAFVYSVNLKYIDISNGIKNIPADTFYCCKKLEDVSIADSVEVIGERAFQDCNRLRVVRISDNSRLSRIESFAFYNTVLEYFDCPAGVQYIGDYAFYGAKLTSFTIPDGFESFNYWTVDECPLNTLIIPGSLVRFEGGTINDGVKDSFSDLKDIYYSGFTSQFNKIEFADRVDTTTFFSSTLHICASGSCGENLLWKAEGLSDDLTLTISGTGKMDDFKPETVPWYAGRDEITKVVIEEGVSYIGDYAFYQLKNLKSVQLAASVKEYGTGVLNGTESLEGFEYHPANGEDACLKIQVQYLEAVYQEEDGVPLKYEPGIIVTKETTAGAENYETFEVLYTDTDRVGNGTLGIRFAEGEYPDIVLPFTVYAKDFEGVNIKPLIKKLTNNAIMTLIKSSFVYTGNRINPVASVKMDGFTLKNGKDYHLSYSPVSVVKAGTYTVIATGKGNYTGTVKKTFTITSKPIKGATVTGITAKSYTGSKITQSPKVAVGGNTLKSGTDYTITYTNNINAGTATMKITGKGNYSGTITRTFKINTVPITKASITTISARVYSGSAQTPVPTIKFGSRSLKKGTDFTLTYKNNKNVGKASVIIKGKGNFTGSKTITFKINPKATTLTSLKAGTKQMTVNWNRQSGQITGYRIQYSTSSAFTNAVTTKVSSVSTVSKVVKKLMSGKTYYVRIQTYKTVGGVNYYSAWSAKKSVKVK